MATYIWNGPAGRGAMKIRREAKRNEAEARNEKAQPVLLHVGSCGHRHGTGKRCAS